MTIRGAKIELWVEERRRRPAVNPVMRALLAALATRGARIGVRVLERELLDGGGRAAKPDLVLLKSATSVALSAALAEEREGVRFLNGAADTVRAHDKASAVATLAAEGLPVPETFLVAPDQRRRRGVRSENGGWIAKPTRGVHGRGVSTHASLADALRAASAPRRPSPLTGDGTHLIQRRVRSVQAELKVYVAGDAVFAGEKRFGRGSYASDEIAPATLRREERAVVVDAGRALGLRLFGVDVVRDAGDGRPVVVDANPLPGYRGFPDAVAPLLGEVERALESG